MSDNMRIVIVGGVAGGASAAARARRLSESARITLIERGEYVSFANCGLPYHIGGVIPERAKLLVQTPESLYASFRIDVRVKTEAVRIDRERKELIVKNVTSGIEENIPYDKLILSPGAEAVRPPIAGSDNGRVRVLRSMSDMDAIIKILDEQKPGNAVVVGGGYIGLEMAEALKERKIGVSLVEMTAQVMGPIDQEMAAPVHQQLRLHGVDLRLETSVTELIEQETGITARLSTGETIDCGLVIMAVGVRPETSLAKNADLAIGERGGILVNDHMLTSDADIYAVGDAIEVVDFVGGFQTLIPLAGPANRQGRIAADNALGRDSKYSGTQGTGICKVFDLAVGMTGANEKTLKRMGVNYQKVFVHPASHATYYPGAAPVSLKLIFDPASGKILGAQGVGTDGVDKRMDVLAVAIRAGLTVFDLEEMELSYAPPYGSAKDPVNLAGFVASNIIRGDLKICHADELFNLREDQIVLDVRKPFEIAAGTVPGAVTIPLDEIRDRVAELPKDKEILVLCGVGQRAYFAYRILTQLGYNCRDISGGYKTYLAYANNLKEKSSGGKDAICDDSGAVCAPPPASLQMSQAKMVKTVDACGLQCPGPIMRVADELKGLNDNEAISIVTTDPGFLSDIGPWCNSTGNRLIEAKPESGRYVAVIAKGSGAVQEAPAASGKKKTIVVFSGEFDKVTAAFVIANGAASMGSEVTMFFTFWGINALRRDKNVAVKKNMIEKMFGWMMPRGADKLKLSNMNMGGMGLAMIKGIMKSKNVPSLPEFIESAQKAGVRMVACTMSMDLMGIKKEELIDGVETGGVAMYLERAESGNVNLFV